MELESPSMSDTITFEVRYRLGEYLAFLRARVGDELRAQAHSKGRTLSRGALLCSSATLAVVGTPMFFYKLLRVGSCRFTIDREGIRRASKSGDLQLSWRDVVSVHEYPVGYLIAKRTGAMPIPRRVLSAPQAAQLSQLVQSWRRESGAA